MSLAPPTGRGLLPRLAILAAAGLVLILGARYFLQRPLTFEANGISLEYPRTWQRVTGAFTPPAGIDLMWVQGFSLDDDNGVGVGAARLEAAVPEALLESVASRLLEPQISEVVAAAGGTLTGPESIEIAGRSSLVYQASGLAIAASPVDVSLAVVPDGAVAYFIACQHTVEYAGEVDAGCETVRSSFTIGAG